MPEPLGFFIHSTLVVVCVVIPRHSILSAIALSFQLLFIFYLQQLSFFSGWDMTCYFCLGWSNHFVSKRKYHIIIPMDDEWHKPLEDGICDLPTHLLHGLIHCNGYAHLVCVNGLEGGSKHLCGREIMDLWDRVCTNLRTR